MTIVVIMILLIKTLIITVGLFRREIKNVCEITGSYQIYMNPTPPHLPKKIIDDDSLSGVQFLLQLLRFSIWSCCNFGSNAFLSWLV